MWVVPEAEMEDPPAPAQRPTRMTREPQQPVRTWLPALAAAQPGRVFPDCREFIWMECSRARLPNSPKPRRISPDRKGRRRRHCAASGAAESSAHRSFAGSTGQRFPGGESAISAGFAGRHDGHSGLQRGPGAGCRRPECDPDGAKSAGKSAADGRSTSRAQEDARRGWQRRGSGGHREKNVR